MKPQTHVTELVGGHRVHPKFHNIVDLAHFLCPTRSVSRFVFNTDENGSELSGFDSKAATITVYLFRIFYSSCKTVQDPKVPFSFRADIWLAFVRETFKQFYQACRSDGTSIRADCEHLNPILPKAPELGKLLAYVGIHYDIEPPLVRDDLFFGPLIENALSAGERRNESWAIHQRKMIHHLFRFPHEMRLAPVAIRNYFKWATGNLRKPDWPQYVPSFNADRAEIEQVALDNDDWQQHQDELAREDARFRREMELLEQVDAKIEKLSTEEGKAR